MTNRSGLSPDVQHSTTTTPSGSLLVDFDSILGQDRQPLTRTKHGTTVSATVTVRSITRLHAGHLRGIVDGDGGSAFIYVAREFANVLRHVFVEGATVKIRGSHTTLGNVPTIGVFAAREVTR